MDDLGIPTDHRAFLNGGREQSRDRRIAQEAELLAQARHSAAMGRTVPDKDVDA